MANENRKCLLWVESCRCEIKSGELSHQGQAGQNMYLNTPFGYLPPNLLPVPQPCILHTDISFLLILEDSRTSQDFILNGHFRQQLFS